MYLHRDYMTTWRELSSMNVAKHQKTATFNYVCSQLNQAAKVTPTPYMPIE